MKRFESILFAFFLACWATSVLHLLGVVYLGDRLAITLRGVFATAAAAGWIAGNVYVARRRGQPPLVRRKLLLIYLFHPPSLGVLTWSMMPANYQHFSPLAPLYCVVISLIFFCVPLLLRWPRGEGESGSG